LLAAEFEEDQVETSVNDVGISRLSDIQVLSQEAAQTAIGIAQEALKDLDRIRSSLGSLHNQLTSAISGISATQINLFASESTIRDVDLSEEIINLSKIQILEQTGTLALYRSTQRSQSLLDLLTNSAQN
jgi:flagellin-like hook-associated protein FlgL